MITKNHFQNAIWVSKNVELDADLESIKKDAKKLMQKSYQRKCDRKMEFFTFYCCVQKF
jgi:hypothetical protein